MFSVISEVNPHKQNWDDYLANAKMLRPELEQVDGFIDNIRYRSLTREGWILSLSNWRDEKSLVRWRTHVRHHEVQEKGRDTILADYRLRVGQITADNQVPAGCSLIEQRLDVTEVGQATAAMMINLSQPSGWEQPSAVGELAKSLGVKPWADRSLSWDIFDAVLTPGELIVLVWWADDTVAQDYERTTPLPKNARLRRVRIVRDYGKYDRREAPQYYRDAEGGNTIHPASLLARSAFGFGDDAGTPYRRS